MYVNKDKDVLYFKGRPDKYWLLATTQNLGTPHCHADDEIAMLQFMAQLKGCRNVAFAIHG